MANEKLLIDLQNIDMNEVDTSDCTDVEDILSAVITYLSEQPIVDAVEVVHGRWEPHPRHPGFDRCSVCCNCIIVDDWADNEKWNYCPNCGAKMDGDGNGG